MCFPVGAVWGGPGNTALLEEVHYWLDFESSPPGPNFGLHSAMLEVKGELSQLPAALLSLQLWTLLRNLQPTTNAYISCPGQVICHSNRGGRDPPRAQSGGAS